MIHWLQMRIKKLEENIKIYRISKFLCKDALFISTSFKRKFLLSTFFPSLRIRNREHLAKARMTLSSKSSRHLYLHE